MPNSLTQHDIDEIDAILDELNQPPRDAHDMPRRVAQCRRALALLPKEDNEEVWATLQFELGNALAQNLLQDMTQNFEHAIAAYQQAMEIYTREAFPEDWALIQKNLGGCLL
jgi:hypothetical protein